MSDSEDIIEEEGADAGPAALKKLREKLKKAVEEKQEYLEGWQRARADFSNYKRQEEDDRGRSEERFKARLLEEMLSALDALELAVRHHEKDQTLGMLEKQFTSALATLGVERFGTPGEPFDPQRHEALAKHGEGSVVETVERSGYKLGDTIIRPAQVII